MLINKIPKLIGSRDKYEIIDKCNFSMVTYENYLKRDDLSSSYIWVLNELAEALGVEIEDLFEEE